MALPEKFAFWKGIPREKIQWNPRIDESKCTGCGMCVTSCGREVFSYDPERNKSVVANPQHCLVGCMSCKTWCVFDAIDFPDPTSVKNLIKERNLLPLAKKQLRAMLDEGRLPKRAE
ncbi:MAG: 4Fe-4S dicluster domain-containing protein [Desulfosoma sp.]